MLNKQKYQSGDFILTKSGNLMVVLSILENNTAQIYRCRETLNWSGDTKEQKICKDEIIGFCHDNQLSEIALFQKAV